MSRVAFILALTSLAVVQAQSPGQVQAGQVVVLAELFTSEGCESCPPADRLLEALLKQQPVEGVYVVPLSEHVTYWDHQGWKDPFGAEQFTARQKAYAFRFNLDGAYTPQLVIDGGRQLIGSDQGELRRVLSTPGSIKPHLQVDVGGTAKVLEVSISGPGLQAVDAVSRKADGKVTMSARSPELFVAVTEDDLVVDVKRGENAGRTMRHVGVVRLLQSLGDSRTVDVPRGAVDSTIHPARAARIELKPEWRRDKLRVVAFVQAKSSQQVLSIGWSAVR